ncbi:MAG TPA: helix-turn-helix domain-containing protein [Mycobacteriales bacterium]|nr:helix-turn-helix domain-containing protein [Mycobacteriales bacterium]
MTEQELPDLTALGLAPAPARVLAVVLDEGWTDAAVVAARAGLSRPQVSAALDALTELGLVARERGGRPARVLATAEVADLADGLARRAQDEAQATARAAAAAARSVREAAARSRVAEPCLRQLEPSLVGAGWRLGCPDRTYEVVAAGDSVEVRFGQHLTRHWVVRRLLVTGQPPADPLAFARANGVLVRRSEQELPALIVVDGTRAAVNVGLRERGGRRGWTTDPVQVRALAQLFELWWEAAADA